MLKLTTVILALFPVICFGDASYQSTTQMNSGMLVNMAKKFAFLSKSMRDLTDPVSEITMVSGNQKAIVSKNYTEIWDLDKKVIIHIDNPTKSYSVTTFADLRKMIQEMPARMAKMQEQLKQAQSQAQGKTPSSVPPNYKFDVSVDVKDTGLSKMIEKYNAFQHILTMKMKMTDANNPDTNVTYSFVEEIWSTPTVPDEMRTVSDFDLRFGQQLMQGMDAKDLMKSLTDMRSGSGMMMMQMFGAQPGSADSFARMQKELAKITGTRLLEITRMGGTGTGIAGQPGATDGSTSTASGGSVAGQVAKDTATQTATQEAGRITNIPGQALASSVLKGFGRKKKPADTPAPAPATTDPSANANTAGAAPTDVTLMEMTVKTYDFSTASVPPSVFQVPAGYKQVQSAIDKMLSQQ